MTDDKTYSDLTDDWGTRIIFRSAVPGVGEPYLAIEVAETDGDGGEAVGRVVFDARPENIQSLRDALDAFMRDAEAHRLAVKFARFRRSEEYSDFPPTVWDQKEILSLIDDGDAYVWNTNSIVADYPMPRFAFGARTRDGGALLGFFADQAIDTMIAKGLIGDDGRTLRTYGA